MRKLRDQLRKNLLTQWDTKKENQKILIVFDKKPPNPDKRRRKKIERLSKREV